MEQRPICTAKNVLPQTSAKSAARPTRPFLGNIHWMEVLLASAAREAKVAQTAFAVAKEMVSVEEVELALETESGMELMGTGTQLHRHTPRRQHVQGNILSWKSTDCNTDQNCMVPSLRLLAKESGQGLAHCSNIPSNNFRRQCHIQKLPSCNHSRSLREH